MGFFTTKSDDAERTRTNEIAASFRDKLAKSFGVTFTQDHGGEFGDAGTIWLTIRHKDPVLGDCHMTMKVVKISKGMV